MLAFCLGSDTCVEDGVVDSRLLRTSWLAGTSVLASFCGDWMEDVDFVGGSFEGCGLGLSAPFSVGGTGLVPFIFARDSFGETLPFLFAMALSSFNILSSHSPLSISSTSCCRIVYRLSSSLIASIIELLYLAYNLSTRVGSLSLCSSASLIVGKAGLGTFRFYVMS